MQNQKDLRRLMSVAVCGVALSMSLNGCASRTAVRGNAGHSPNAKVVVISKSHVHSLRCGHYRYNGDWYFIRGHVHGVRCGHRVVDGVWIFRKIESQPTSGF